MISRYVVDSIEYAEGCENYERVQLLCTLDQLDKPGTSAARSVTFEALNYNTAPANCKVATCSVVVQATG